MCLMVKKFFDCQRFEVFSDVPIEATGWISDKAKSRDTVGFGGGKDLIEHLVWVVFKKEFSAFF